MNNHALVVGASSGIGRAVVGRLVKWSKVTAIARRTERLSVLEEFGATTISCDATDFGALEAAINGAVERVGQFSAVVYCAGAQQIKPLRSVKTTDIFSIMNINLLAPIFLAKCFSSQKISKSDAVFCAVSSVAAQRPEAGIIPYSVAKAGLDALIKGIAKELGPRRAVGVAPGWLDTEMTQAYGHIYNEEFKAALVKRSPAGIATVESVADVVEFLLSDRARHLTGQIITVDGGSVL